MASRHGARIAPKQQVTRRGTGELRFPRHPVGGSSSNVAHGPHQANGRLAQHRSLRAHHGPGLLGVGPRGHAGNVQRVLPREPLWRRLRHRLRHGPDSRPRRELRLRRRGHRVSRQHSRTRRRLHVQARLPRVPAQPLPRPHDSRRARGRRGLSARAHGARPGPPHRLPAHRDRPAQPRELPDPRGDKDLARGSRGRGPSGLGLWPEARTGTRRWSRGCPRLLHRRRKLHLEPPCGQDLRHPRLWHARALLGHGVSHRA